MKMAGQLGGLVLLAICVNAGANEIERGSSRNVASRLVAKQTLKVEQYSPTQIVCMTRKRNGSRVSRKVCQTIAAWVQEANERVMRQQHLIRPQGKRASWELDY